LAGTNKVLKDGTVLFRAGDKSDGMYLIRRGEVRVYLEQDGKEVQLATIGEGGMIGEMALFDGAPRSASVKASQECEVTQISTEDFAKLMKQIPKWFVSLMSALSSRLRQTNDRLKKLESTMAGSAAGATPGASKGKPFQNIIRQLNIIILLWHKDGEKDGKDWTIQKASLEKALIELFNEDPEKIKALFEVLVKQKVLTTRQDSYKNVVFAMAGRGALNSLVAAIGTFLKSKPKSPCLSDPALDMLRTLERVATTAPYDSTTVALPDLIKEGKRGGMTVILWDKEIDSLQNAGEEVRVVKTSSGQGLRTSKKEVAAFVRNHELIAALYKANLS